MLNTHHYLMKKVLIVILALLLTIVWSSAAVRMSDKASVWHYCLSPTQYAPLQPIQWASMI